MCKPPCNSGTAYNSSLSFSGEGPEKTIRRSKYCPIVIRFDTQKAPVYRRKRKMPEHPEPGLECIRHGLSTWCPAAESNYELILTMDLLCRLTSGATAREII